MIVEPLEFDTALYVTTRLRAADAREIYATRIDEDPARLAADAAARVPFAWCAGKGEPIACIGVVPLWPGVWEAWMFATDRFSEIGLPLTRFAKRGIIPAVAAAGAHRIHCHSIEGHDQAHRWLEALGAVRESEKTGYGKGGETFYVYRLSL